MNNQKTYPDTIWGVRSITGTSEELLSKLEKKELYRPVLSRIKLEKRKKEWLSVRLLLKELLGEEKEIEYNNAGRPFFRDRSFHISISHTAGYVAVILNPNHPVGIDVEQITEQVVSLQERFLSEKERSRISKGKELIHLLLHWSAKETMFKALGEEEVIFKEHLHINPFDPQVGILSTFSSFESRTYRKTEFLIHYMVDSEYVLTFTEL